MILGKIYCYYIRRESLADVLSLDVRPILINCLKREVLHSTGMAQKDLRDFLLPISLLSLSELVYRQGYLIVIVIFIIFRETVETNIRTNMHKATYKVRVAHEGRTLIRSNQHR